MDRSELFFIPGSTCAQVTVGDNDGCIGKRPACVVCKWVLSGRTTCVEVSCIIFLKWICHCLL